MDKQTQPTAPNEPSSLKFDSPVFYRMAMSVLYDLEEYLDRHADVIDGDYGQPRNNEEMTLLGDVRLAIRLGEAGK